MNRLTDYIVGDLLPSAEMLSVVFLLESPYINEVIHKHPLAGKSGKTVANWLVGNTEAFSDWSAEEPIGCQLKKWMVGYSRVGLMNCSARPMDESAYSCVLGPADRWTVSALNLIRSGTREGIRANPMATDLERRLLIDLRQRLMMLPASTLLVPCGEFARSMARKARVARLDVYGGRIPHPSRQSWTSERYQSVMDELKERLRSALV